MPSTSELIGNPRQAAQELLAFKRTAKVFSSEHPRLIDDYAQKWVAVIDGAVAAEATELDDLVQILKTRDLPRRKTLVRFIERNHRAMIL